MTTTIRTLVESWLERKADDQPPRGPGYRPSFRLPRPPVDALPLSFRFESRMGGRCLCVLTDEDGEEVRSDADEPIVGVGADPREAITDAVAAAEECIDAIVDSMESAYHSSDEAMRATHPREM